MCESVKGGWLITSVFFFLLAENCVGCSLGQLRTGLWLILRAAQPAHQRPQLCLAPGEREAGQSTAPGGTLPLGTLPRRRGACGPEVSPGLQGWWAGPWLSRRRSWGLTVP